MARTALDLTPAELQVYRPVREPDEQQVIARWERALKIAHVAAGLLREEFGATRVVGFGSVAHRAWFTPQSDIDVAAWDIPADQFYRAVAAVTGLSSEFAVDLVDPQGCRPAIRLRIEREGMEL